MIFKATSTKFARSHELLQLAKDNGVKKALILIENKRQFRSQW